MDCYFQIMNRFRTENNSFFWNVLNGFVKVLLFLFSAFDAITSFFLTFQKDANQWCAVTVFSLLDQQLPIF